MATYSSRGPTLIDGVLKPELVAPGNRIVAAAARRVASWRGRIPERVVAGHGRDAYIEMSGTSMSAAVVVGGGGAAARGAPALTPAEVKAVLQMTSSRVAGRRPDRGGCREPERAVRCGWRWAETAGSHEDSR